MELSIPRLAAKIPTEAAAYEFLEDLRWHGQPVCPHCGSIGDHRYLEPTNKVSRETSRGKQSERRVWKCRDCKRQFSAITNTIMHGTHVPIRTWLFVIFEMVSNKNGVAAREVERRYDLHPKTAWFMLHRIREAMSTRDGNPFTGVLIADETWIGGKPSNRHGHKKGQGGQGKTDKTPVVSLVHAETGEVRSQVVTNVQGKTLRKVIAENAILAETTLHTDTAGTYGTFADELAAHATVNHFAGEYVRSGVSTNLAEGYFSQLKRSLDGTHHHVSREHLHRYLGEFDFRYSTCDMTDTERMGRFMGKVAGRRMSYK